MKILASIGAAALMFATVAPVTAAEAQPGWHRGHGGYDYRNGRGWHGSRWYGRHGRRYGYYGYRRGWHGRGGYRGYHGHGWRRY